MNEEFLGSEYVEEIIKDILIDDKTIRMLQLHLSPYMNKQYVIKTVFPLIHNIIEPSPDGTEFQQVMLGGLPNVKQWYANHNKNHATNMTAKMLANPIRFIVELIVKPTALSYIKKYLKKSPQTTTETVLYSGGGIFSRENLEDVIILIAGLILVAIALALLLPMRIFCLIYDNTFPNLCNDNKELFNIFFGGGKATSFINKKTKDLLVSTGRSISKTLHKILSSKCYQNIMCCISIARVCSSMEVNNDVRLIQLRDEVSKYLISKASEQIDDFKTIVNKVLRNEQESVVEDSHPIDYSRTSDRQENRLELKNEIDNLVESHLRRNGSKTSAEIKNIKLLFHHQLQLHGNRENQVIRQDLEQQYKMSLPTNQDVAKINLESFLGKLLGNRILGTLSKSKFKIVFGDVNRSISDVRNKLNIDATNGNVTPHPRVVGGSYKNTHTV